MAKIDSSKWFEYSIRVQPHHTDYGGVVWHGAYVTWLESARVECLRAAGVPFERLLSLGCDLPVVNLEVRYRQPLTLGMTAVVRTRLAPMKGLRLTWLYEVVTIDAEDVQLYLTAQVTLVAVSVSDRKVIRQLPTPIKEVIDQISQYFDQ